MLLRLSVLCFILLTGCSSTDYSDELLRQRFVGKTKPELLSCAGIPQAQQDIGDKEILTYEAESLFGYQGIIITASCRFNFILQDDEIESIRVNWSGPLIDQNMACGRIAQGCWNESLKASPISDQRYY